MEKYLKILKNVSLFEGIEEMDILSILSCLSAVTVNFDKKQAVLIEGDNTDKVGIVLSGQIQIIKEDFYGNRNIVAVFDEGKLFAETFVCAEIKTLPVSVFTTTESVIMFINFSKLINTCEKPCVFHNKLIYNMLRIIAKKNIILNQKIEFTSKRTTREKLLAYLSAEAKKAKSSSFIIPLNRQELADYLSVERSAMSAELCRLRDDGVLNFNKNNFELL
ncbi:MAG: Crp/Fnr family transcriptional regulator [Bacillota bacterium]|nr:Crp/Fnr family transcriptional regulator [Bacillota bacterium]